MTSAVRRFKPWEYPPVYKAKVEDSEVGITVPDRAKVFPFSSDDSRDPTAYCAQLLDDPPTRAQAVERLVATFRPEVFAAQHERWTTTTLSGRPIADAPDDYLAAEAVGLYCWSRDRQANGVRNRGAWAWVQASVEAVNQPSGVPSSRKAA